MVFSGAREFEMREGFIFAVTEEEVEEEQEEGEGEQEEGGEEKEEAGRVLHVGRPEERLVVAEFPPTQARLLDFHVAEVTEDGGLLVIVNHASNLSSLYIRCQSSSFSSFPFPSYSSFPSSSSTLSSLSTSDLVSEYSVQFSLALPRIMYYAKVRNIKKDIYLKK